MKSKSTTTNTVTVTHYGDSKTSGTIIDSANGFDPTNASANISDQRKSTDIGPHVFHSLEFSMTTNDETKGFEPLFVGGYYEIQRKSIK